MNFTKCFVLFCLFLFIGLLVWAGKFISNQTKPENQFDATCLEQLWIEYPNAAPAKQVVVLGRDRVMVMFLTEQTIFTAKGIRSGTASVFERALEQYQSGENHRPEMLLFSKLPNGKFILTIPNALPATDNGCSNVPL